MESEKLNQQALNSIKLPLPDLDTQRAIVAKIQEEQRLVNATKELVRLFEAKVNATINRVWGDDVHGMSVCAEISAHSEIPNARTKA